MKGLFGLFPDVERAKYANESSEAKLEKMLSDVLKNICFAGCSKTSRCKAPEVPKSEAYITVRRNDEE